MTDLRKAAEMALEAFEILDNRGGLGLDVHEYIRTKIEALRQALAQAEQEPVAWMYESRGRIYFTTADQRPVEASFPHFNKSTPLYTAPPISDYHEGWEEGFKAAKREHEPVAWVIEDGEVDYYTDVVAKIKPGTPLYTAPPKQWVKLTDEEIQKLQHQNWEERWLYVEFARAIEAKLKEKNG